jgi:hypothetical protein
MIRSAFNGVRLAATKFAAADAAAAAVAVSLPWSTSATAILVGVWLVCAAFTVDLADIRREAMTWAGGLPIALWTLALFGMLWADSEWPARIGGLAVFVKLLTLPVLLAQFRKSPNGQWVLFGFLAGATALLVISLGLSLIPGLIWRGKTLGVPVKDYISQAGIFTLCIFALAWLAIDFWQQARRPLAIALAALVAIFFADVLYIATSRTALIVICALLGLLLYKKFRWKQVIGACVAGAVIAAIVWQSSPYLRDRVHSVNAELDFAKEGGETSAGLRVEYWKKSLKFFASAPLIGHGTGTTTKLFKDDSIGKQGLDAVLSDNPHNQTLAVAIQLGSIGVILLYAMWIAHFMLFRFGTDIVAWIGQIVVLENVISSLFNSHLQDFSQGWLYVVGVGVAGGMMRGRQRAVGQIPNEPSSVPREMPPTGTPVS